MSENSLEIGLHDAQQIMFADPARFVVCAAGRRFGKSHYAIAKLIDTAARSALDVTYVAPTFGQAKDIIWDQLIDVTAPIQDGYHINDGWVRLINGRKIHIKGADRPDTMRGTARSLYVLDEFGDMKPEVWETIVRPQLSDAEGDALFIGTPKGRNHFYALAKAAENGFEQDDGELRKDPDWSYYHWTTYDNPYIKPKEIAAAKATMSDFAFRQEYLASFEAAASELFNPNNFYITEDEPLGGQYYISVDLAGFAESDGRSKLAYRDEHAIAIVKVTPEGKWWVKEIQHGRWPIRETALRIVKAVRDYRPLKVGIEKGALKNAIDPIIREEMARLNTWFEIVPLTHGNKAKTDRIVWALQGRMEKARITFNQGKWTSDLLDQMMQFPDKKTRDDLVDALSYIAQLINPNGGVVQFFDTHDVLDPISGY